VWFLEGEPFLSEAEYLAAVDCQRRNGRKGDGRKAEDSS